MHNSGKAPGDRLPLRIRIRPCPTSRSRVSRRTPISIRFFAKHEPILEKALVECNAALAKAPPEPKTKLATKLIAKQKAEGKPFDWGNQDRPQA
jgi:hypothetical protein